MPTAVERYFMKLDGIDAIVNVELNIESFNWGSTVANAGDGSVSRPRFSEIHITRQLDTSSPALFHAAAGGQRLRGATIFCRKAGGDTQISLVSYVLIDPFITSYAHAGNQHGGLPVESLSLTFSRIDFAVTTNLG